MAQKIEIVVEATGFDTVAKGAQNVSKSLAVTAKEAQKLDSTLAGGFKNGANQATQALTNLGRVAQDAPFGFIGIANNINPLLESFQRLKTETKSTGGALKALGSSLIGAGGLGLAVSVVTAAVSFATNGFGAWTRGLGQNKKAIEDTKNAYDGIIASLTTEQIKIDKIVTAIKEENLTRKQRIEAINQLQKAAPAYFSNLDKEKSTIEQITIAYNAFSASILRSIEAKVRERQLIEITDEILKLKDKATNLGQDEVLIAGKLVKVNRQRYDADSEGLTTQQAYQATMKGIIGLTNEEIKRLDVLEKTRQRLLQLITQASGAEIFNTTQGKSGITKVKEDVDSLKRKVLDVNRVITQDFLDVFYGDKTGGKPVTNIKPIGVPIEIKLPKTLIDEAKGKELGEQLTAFFESLAVEIGVAFGEALGNAIAGTGSIKGVFQSLFSVVGAALQRLGAVFIKSAAIIKKIESVIIKNPALAIAGGIALVALGSVLKNVSAFAVGTRNAPGGLALVGERGPELISVPRGAQVTPAAQTANIIGGMQAIEVYGMVRGQDIYFSNKRFAGTLSRNT